MKKKFRCDCGSESPHGAEDCHYTLMAQAILAALKELEEETKKKTESDAWEKLRRG